MFSDMSTKRNWEALSKLQLKDGKISSGDSGDTSKSGTMTSPLKLAAAQHQQRRSYDHDDDDEESHLPKKRSAGEDKPVNLLDALQGLNKLVNKSKKKENDRILGKEKKVVSVDDYLKNQNKQNMARSKSQGML